MTDNKGTKWWGSFDFQTDAARCWRIANLELWVHRLPKEWRIGFRETSHSDIEKNSFAINGGDKIPDEFLNPERYLVSKTRDTLLVRPALAPRPVVVRPDSPLHIPGGISVSLFVSTPVWMQFCVDEQAAPLRELAIVRPSDTWFGSNTMEGELCYSARSRGTLDANSISYKPHRAVTQIHIRNLAQETLVLDRISLPVGLLALYADSQERLCTQDISLTREDDAEFARVDIEDNPPDQAKHGSRITAPRDTADKGILLRAFQSIFS